MQDSSVHVRLSNEKEEGVLMNLQLNTHHNTPGRRVFAQQALLTQSGASNRV